MDVANQFQSDDAFQERGRAWHPDRGDIVLLLETAEHADIQPIYYGSNECFLVTLDQAGAGQSLAVYKPAAGEYPLYDFPCGTLYRREVGASLLDRALGWNLVPPTVVTDGIYGPGSLQLYIENHSRGAIEVSELRRLALFDVVVNNADRKPDHVLIGDGERLWGIDHGLTFHALPKLRTILWHFAGMPLEEAELQDLRRISKSLDRGRSGLDALYDLVSASELTALKSRIHRLLESGEFPNPRSKSVPYRW